MDPCVVDIHVNDDIADKNVVTKNMNNSTGLQCIELNGFARGHWKTGYSPSAYGWSLALCCGLGLYLLFIGLGYSQHLVPNSMQ